MLREILWKLAMLAKRKRPDTYGKPKRGSAQKARAAK
jgi:hypothetical protein